MLYVGVDAHKSASQLTVVDELGEILDRRRVASTRAALVGALEGNGGEPIKAVLEAGYGWGPIYDWLGEVADEVVLAHPTKVRAIAEARIKNDRLDSEILAHLLRADLIPEAYAPSKEARAMKRVLRQRMFLVRLRTMVKNRIRALLFQHGVEPPPVSDLFGKKGLAWLKEEPELPAPDGWLLGEEVELAETLKAKIRATEGLIGELGRGRRGGRVAQERAGHRRVFLGFDPPRGRRDGALPEPQEVRQLHGADPFDLRLRQEDHPWEAHQGGQQMAEVGIHRGGEPGDPSLALPARLLPAHQEPPRGQGCKDRYG